MSENLIIQLPTAISRMKLLVELQVDGNPLTVPPPQVVSHMCDECFWCYFTYVYICVCMHVYVYCMCVYVCVCVCALCSVLCA